MFHRVLGVCVWGFGCFLKSGLVLQDQLFLLNENGFAGSVKENVAYRLFKATVEGTVLKLGKFPPMPVKERVDCGLSADDIAQFVVAVKPNVQETATLDIAGFQVSKVCVCVCVCVFASIYGVCVFLHGCVCVFGVKITQCMCVCVCV